MGRQKRMSVRHKNYWHILSVATLLAATSATPTEESKTVLGPSNIYLYDGANALMAGDGEEGVRLTVQGLKVAHGTREERVGHANLCAGYLMIDQPATALVHCNWVLERNARHWRTYNNRALVYMRLERYEEAEDDIRKGQELRPNSRNLKIVKGMYLDETKPVTPRVEADDRRTPPKEPSDELAGDVDD